MLHQTVEKLLSLCADLRIAIVEDDPSSLLTLEKKQPCPTLKSIDENGTVIMYILYQNDCARITSRLARRSAICSRKVIRRKASNGIRNEYFPSVAYAAVFETVPFQSHIVPLRKQLAEKETLLFEL